MTYSIPCSDQISTINDKPATKRIRKRIDAKILKILPRDEYVTVSEIQMTIPSSTYQQVTGSLIRLESMGLIQVNRAVEPCRYSAFSEMVA